MGNMIGKALLLNESRKIKDIEVLGYDLMGYKFQSTLKKPIIIKLFGKNILLRSGLYEDTYKLDITASDLIKLIEKSENDGSILLKITLDLGVGVTQTTVIPRKLFKKIKEQLEIAKIRSEKIEKEHKIALEKDGCFAMPNMRCDE